MRLQFSARATAFSKKTQFAKDVLNRFLCYNHSTCTYQQGPITDGAFAVDFELGPRAQAAGGYGAAPPHTVTDTLKFFFYTSANPTVVVGGFVPMECVAKTMSDPAHRAQYTFTSNFNSVAVHLQFVPAGAAAPPPALPPAMARSALWDSAPCIALYKAYTLALNQVLGQTLQMRPSTGAPMFANLLSAHNFQDQLTTHTLFQRDVEPDASDTQLFYMTGLTMTALCETLQAQMVGVKAALEMKEGSREFTALAAGACQSFMRSAHVCPYLSDLNLGEALNALGETQLVNGESFRLPLHEPFLHSSGKALFLNADDCDGQATWMLYKFRSFQHLYEGVRAGGAPPPMDSLFPPHLFALGADEKADVMRLALKIGRAASEGSLRCDTLLLSTTAPSMGGADGDGLGGHATCILSNHHNPEAPFDILMEGTNSICEDDDNSVVACCSASGPVLMSLTAVANQLTGQIMGAGSREDSRMVMHFNVSHNQGFYRTGFCQNGVLLGTALAGGAIEYGVNMQSISDYGKKVLMPVSPSLLCDLTNNKRATDFLDANAAMRRHEIHPPAASLDDVLDATRAWTPISLYVPDPDTATRPFKSCLATRAYRTKAERETGLMAARLMASSWNTNPKTKDIGVMTIYPAMDCVCTRLCMWTDNTKALETALEDAIGKTAQTTPQQVGGGAQPPAADAEAPAAPGSDSE